MAVNITPLEHRGFGLRPLLNDTGLRLVIRNFDGLVQQRFVLDYTLDFDAAGG